MFLCTIARMDSPHLDSALRIKNNRMRGGEIERVFVRNVEVGQISMAGLSVDFHYEEGEAGNFTPVVRDVEVNNLTIRRAEYAVYLRGFKDAPIEGVRITDCDFEGVLKASVMENVQDISLRHVRINGRQVSSPLSAGRDILSVLMAPSRREIPHRK